ncbi:MAG: D-alanyl-D-alanine carboxypeptidase [Oscillospiraceae bacterium]|nr:D-alanyl-D-alanine carboxypeptidase [Oscillospiraceae bacterium]
MKKNRVICLILSAVMLLSALGAGVSAESVDYSASAGCHSEDAAKPLGGGDKLLDTSKAVILYELNSGTMVYAYNPDQTIYPSSMVKIMTALVALENGDLNSAAVVTRNALSHVAIGSVSAKLQEGEEISLESLLYCMIAASANDAAVVIAEHIAGSEAAFLEMMNGKAQALGCTGTHFSNVHGLHDEQTYTTARDVCKILTAALENDTFKTIFETEVYTVPATNKSGERRVVTTNYMMSKDYTSKYFDSRVTGGKTGATDEAGRCLAVTAEVGSMKLLAVVMGAKPTYEEEGISLKTFGSYEEMKVLLDYAEEKYEFRQIFYENQTFSQYPVAGGANNVVTTPVTPMSTVLPVNLKQEELSWVYGDTPANITAPVAKGQRIGNMQVWYGDICIAQSDLVAMNAVEVWVEPTEPTGPVTHDEDFDGTMIAVVLAVLLGLILLGLAVFFAVNAIRRAAARARRRRRRRNRRRNR